MTIKSKIYITLSILLLVISAYMVHLILMPIPNRSASGLPTFTLSDLKTHDGTDPNIPIYIAMEGYVYDVTTGKSYYEPGGTYHWLTGKDATMDLRIAGGEIIKRKYPIIGIYKP